MRIFYLWFLVGCWSVSPAVQAQSPTIPLNSDYYHLIDRLEIKQGRWADGFHSTVKPYNRHTVVRLTDSLLNDPWARLSRVDRFSISYLRDDSWEWVSTAPVDTSTLLGIRLAEERSVGKKPGDSRRHLGPFYRKKSDFYSYEDENFDLHISPVANFGYGWESNSGPSYNAPVTSRPGGANLNPYINTRGIEIRGSIGKKLGFYTYMADNQALFSRYIQEYGTDYAVNSGLSFAPSEGLTKWTKTTPFGQGIEGADFLSARGYITFNALKIINIQFGHDRNFFGNGYRSLLLSDNSAPYLFLKITTRFGRFLYTNLLTEFQNTQQYTTNELHPRKYAAMHHLSINLGNHFNLGLFEAEVFSRDQLELNYLNPIIFYRFVESFRGSADNALVGLDFKANFLRHFLVYGQVMLDELIISDLRAGNGSWTNKFAVQAGLKYVDAFGIPNLDLQGEVNLARPYTYSHRSGQTNYVHYNQPLAHPLGANFIEALGILKYQPFNRLTVTGILGAMRYGVDPPNRNYGGNLLKNYEEPQSQTGNYIAQGRETLVLSGDLRLSYMMKHNLFIDVRQLIRKSDSQVNRLVYNTLSTSVALRWNLPYRTLTL